MTGSVIDLNQACDIVTAAPDRRMGPMVLRAAVRCVVTHRPEAEIVLIELKDGTQLEEVVIEAIYEIASATCFVAASQVEALR